MEGKQEQSIKIDFSGAAQNKPLNTKENKSVVADEIWKGKYEGKEYESIDEAKKSIKSDIANELKRLEKTELSIEWRRYYRELNYDVDINFQGSLLWHGSVTVRNVQWRQLGHIAILDGAFPFLQKLEKIVRMAVNIVLRRVLPGILRDKIETTATTSEETEEKIRELSQPKPVNSNLIFPDALKLDTGRADLYIRVMFLIIQGGFLLVILSLLYRVVPFETYFKY